MTIKLFITKSKKENKKYDLLDENKKYILSFGASGYSDYTQHGDYERKKRYLNRHAPSKTNEDWHKSGLYTAGWASRWILWNLPSLKDSIRDANHRFNLDIKLI